MSFDPANYHPDWHWMSRQIKAQTNNACEWCGVPNGERGARGERRRWYSEAEIAALDPLYRSIVWLNGTPRLIRIVLTVHHQCDCDKRLCWDPTHLVSLCQRCHLKADLPHHIEVRQANRLARKLAKPLPLFEGITS